MLLSMVGNPICIMSAPGVMREFELEEEDVAGGGTDSKRRSLKCASFTTTP